MKKEDLYEAVGELDDELLRDTAFHKPAHTLRWASVLIASAAAVCLLIVSVFRNDPGIREGLLIAQAEVPEYTLPEDMTAEEYLAQSGQDAFAKEQFNYRMQAAENAPYFNTFHHNVMRSFLQDQSEENRVFSPSCTWNMLAMLAECTDGNTRKQLLDYMGVQDLEQIRKMSDLMWKASWAKNPVEIQTSASSFWMNQNIRYQKQVLELLAETYHASSYQGEMGSEELNAELRTWLNENTGGILKEYVSKTETYADTAFLLASAQYLKASWTEKFDESLTAKEVFHSPDGDVTADMMHKNEIMGSIYLGDRFKAMTVGGLGMGMTCMDIVLPNEGIALQDLCDDAQMMEFLERSGEFESERFKSGIIDLAMPRFTVSESTDLKDMLQKAGITDLFTPGNADFSPLTDTENVYLNRFVSGVKVSADENGVEAAAFEIGAGAMGGVEPVHYDFTADRPFIFVIRGPAGTLLYTGTVYRP